MIVKRNGNSSSSKGGKRRRRATKLILKRHLFYVGFGFRFFLSQRPRRVAHRTSWWELLPQEIQRDILSRFRVQDLVQFMEISRSWKQLIEDPVFIKMHAQRAVDRECTLVYDDKNNSLHPLEDAPPSNYYAIEMKFDGTFGNDFRRELPLPVRYPSCTTPISIWCATPISGYSNGLLLVENKALIVLWNPILQKYKKVLSPSPLKGWVSRFALGYEPCSADYVIISWLQKGYEVINWKSYSVKAERWKNTEEQWPMQYGMCKRRKAVSSMGHLYWLVFRLTIHPKDLVELLAFDIKTENFEICRLPNQITFNHTQSDENQYICFDVQGKVWLGFQNQYWIMDESNYWTPFYRFELQEFGCCIPLLSYEDARWVFLKIDRFSQRWFDREKGQFWDQEIHFTLHPGYFQMVLGTLALLDGDKCERYEKKEDYMVLPRCFHLCQYV